MIEEKELGDQIVEIDGNKFMNFHGFLVPTFGKYSPDFFIDIATRRNNNKSNIMIITGSPGEGKSYCALRLAQIFDSRFDVNIQVVFRREELLKLIGAESPLKRGQVIIVDEAQYVAGSRRWYEEVQKDLMEAIESVRSKGFIIIIVALHLNLMDVVIRKYVLSHMIFMERPGRGIVYDLWTPRFSNEMHRKRQCPIEIQLPGYEECASPTCLTCRYREKCVNIRAIYERRKHDFLNERAEESRQRILERKKARASKRMTNDEYCKILLEHVDSIWFNNRGDVDANWIYSTLEDQDILVGKTKARRIRDYFSRKHENSIPSKNRR